MWQASHECHMTTLSRIRFPPIIFSNLPDLKPRRPNENDFVINSHEQCRNTLLREFSVDIVKCLLESRHSINTRDVITMLQPEDGSSLQPSRCHETVKTQTRCWGICRLMMTSWKQKHETMKVSESWLAFTVSLPWLIDEGIIFRCAMILLQGSQNINASELEKSNLNTL